MAVEVTVRHEQIQFDTFVDHAIYANKKQK